MIVRFILKALITAALGMSVALPATAELAAALLPSSRSTEVGSTVTVFSTIINAGSETATGCQIEQLTALPLSLSYQTTDPTTNASTGTANTPVVILPGQAQSFVLSITPSAFIDSTEVEFSFTCSSGTSATTIAGVNTLLLSASETPVVDIIALSATAQNTGLLALENSVGAFALATINLGTADSITVTADTGSQLLPVTLTLCETDPETGACLTNPAASVETTVSAGGTPTFSVFSNATGAIANNPALNRVFVRFTDSNGVVRGGTSVALENQLAIDAPALSANTISALSEGLNGLTLANTQAAGSSNTPFFGNTGSEVFSLALSCPTGQILFNGTVNQDQQGNSNSEIIITYDNCEGLNGTVDVSSSTTLVGTVATFASTQNGSYSSNECSEITVNNIQTTATFDLESLFLTPIGSMPEVIDLSDQTVFTTSGSISGVCNGEAFNCSLEEGHDLENQPALANSCST